MQHGSSEPCFGGVLNGGRAGHLIAYDAVACCDLFAKYFKGKVTQRFHVGISGILTQSGTGGKAKQKIPQS